MKFTKNKIVRCDAGIAPQKHYLKKILSLLLSIAILFAITAGIDLSAYALESGDYEYQLLYDGTAAIEKYNGKESNVVVPSKIDGYAVSQINGFAFENCSTVKTVEISNGIKKLIGQVFFLCENLTDISIPDSMEDIDSSGFYSYNLKNINVSANNQKYKSVNGILYNKNLSELIEYPRGKEDSEFIIPSSVKVIGETTNEHLKKVTISKNVESIPYLAFDLCSALEEVIIEDGVKTIEDFAFSGCDSLNKITIPKSVTTIYGGAIGSTYNTWGSTVCGDPTIYGYKNSAAEAYAKKYSIKFIALDGECVHAWNSGKVTKAATCTANGVKTYTCTKCKATKTEAIKATGHSYDAGKVTKAPTATTAGVKTYTCTKCKATKTETIKATGLKTPVLKAAVNANGTIKLSWGKVAGAEKYELYIKQADGSYKLMKTTNATSFTTAFATYGKQFTYKMRAVAGNTKSAYSAAVNATNTKKLQTPAMKATVNANGTFKLSWNAVAGATSYQLYIKQADGSYKLMKTTNATSFTTAFATYGKQFTYKMRAVTSKNNSATSAYSSAVNATNNKKLQTPTLKVAVNANGTFKLSWNKVAGATSYQLYIKQADGSYKLMKTTTGTSFTTAFATYGKQFTYKMRAVTSKNSSATSAYSAAVNAKNTKKLQTPTLKVAVNKNGSFKLTWGKVTGATSYQLYIKQANGSYKLMKTTSSTSFTTAVAAKGKTYSYKVRAVTSKNKNATSNFSNVVNAKRK